MKEVLEILFRYSTDNSEDNPSPDILRCLEELSVYLKQKGIHHELQKYDVISSSGITVPRANLFAYNPKAKGQHILFQGHIDTVPFASPYAFSITEKEVIGRGAVDMKGALAAMIKAFEELYENIDKKYAPALLLTSDEEANGFAGIDHFLKTNTIPIAFIINGEPTNLSVASHLRGVSMYQFDRYGESGHSSSSLNDRLIEKTIPLINAIQKYLDNARNITHPMFGDTIGALTVVKAGIKDNQLPEHLRISFNVRTVREKEMYEKIYGEIVSPEIAQDIKVTHQAFDPIVATVDSDIIEAFKKAYQNVGMEYRESVVNAFTEASILNKNGIPTVVCGPGDMLNAHVRPEKEIVSMADLEKYHQLLVNFFQEVAKSPLT